MLLPLVLILLTAFAVTPAVEVWDVAVEAWPATAGAPWPSDGAVGWFRTMLNAKADTRRDTMHTSVTRRLQRRRMVSGRSRHLGSRGCVGFEGGLGWGGFE